LFTDERGDGGEFLAQPTCHRGHRGAFHELDRPRLCLEKTQHFLVNDRVAFGPFRDEALAFLRRLLERLFKQGVNLFPELGVHRLITTELSIKPRLGFVPFTHDRDRCDLHYFGSLVDTDKVVDGFVPEIIDSAVDLYGRGMPPQTIANLTVVAQPIMPALKDRARIEIPKLIRDRTSKFEHVPFAAIVMGADRYLDIKIDGNNAAVTSKIKIGTGVINPFTRHPVLIAMELAALDQLSGGRAIL